MMNHRATRNWAAAFVLALCSLAAPSMAAPWILYGDPDSESLCDVVNAANMELVVLSDTGELVRISGDDVIFGDTFVDDEGRVFFLGDPAGTIDFVEDGDGFRTLWWLTSFGDAAEVDGFGDPVPSGQLPNSFVDVPCDACPFWDIPSDCTDSDGDGVDDTDDLCADTPITEVIDPVGCSCGQLDSDGDGIVDCDDRCDGTPTDEAADSDGCSCSNFDTDADGVSDCNDLCSGTPSNEVADAEGCSCSNFDSDADGIFDCRDLCAGTAPNVVIDVDGCEVVVVVDGGGSSGGGPGVVVLNLCGSMGALIPVLTLFGLLSLSFLPRQRR